MTVFDFMQEPVHVEPPLVGRVHPQSAARSYNAALAVLNRWNEKAQAPSGALGAHRALPQTWRSLVLHHRWL